MMEQIAAHTILALEFGKLRHSLTSLLVESGSRTYLRRKALAAKNLDNVQAVPIHILLFDWMVMTNATAQNKISSEFNIAFAFKLFHRENLAQCSDMS